MKTCWGILGIALGCLILTSAKGQQLYADFEGKRPFYFTYKTGVIDSTFRNQNPDKVNPSLNCVKYHRSRSKKYDQITMSFVRKLEDVSQFSNYDENRLKIKMKVRSDAPVGTPIEIQLCKRGDGGYPSGVHSVYRAATSKQNEWEELTFNFVEIPKGSRVGANQADQMNILFAPDTQTNNFYYFDDIYGPQVAEPFLKIISAGKP